MSRVARRLDSIAPTIFGQMSALAVETSSVNLGQGFPDTAGPAAVIERAVQGLRGDQNQYPPGIGRPDLRRAIATHQQRNYGIDLDPDTEVVVTTGCTEAIAGAILGLVNPRDAVVVLEPYYDSYVAMIHFAGGVRRPVTLRAPDYRLDVDELARAAVGARVLLVNTPHNPTGTVLTRAESEALAAVAIEHDLTVITDEVYEHLVYDGRQHVPLATLPGMFKRTVTLSSVGKSMSLTGWKVGWATGPAHLVAGVLGAKQWLSYTSAGPLQSAVATALDDETAFPIDLAASLAQRRDLLVEGLRALGLPTRSPEGTYFALSDVSGLGWADGREFCLDLPHRAGVVAIPAQVFYDDLGAGGHLVRWAFCKDTPVIEEGLRRLSAVSLRR